MKLNEEMINEAFGGKTQASTGGFTNESMEDNSCALTEKVAQMLTKGTMAGMVKAIDATIEVNEIANLLDSLTGNKEKAAYRQGVQDVLHVFYHVAAILAEREAKGQPLSGPSTKDN